MEKVQIEEIKECLPKGRTKFYYFKDRYALMLLANSIGQGKSIGEIKKSRLRKLLTKPAVQQVLQRTGNGYLTAADLASFWPEEYHCYLLTLGEWGDRKSHSRFYNQTTRSGWNLVLQLNFSAQHNSAYQRLIQPGDQHPFHSMGHPIAENGNHTLAWARIDLDIESGEALIEEIQTDWIRLAARSLRMVTAYNGEIPRQRYLPRCVRRLGCDVQELAHYVEEELKFHKRTWAEAMLASTVWFLKEEMGLNTIFYHTFDSGCQLKRIGGRRPPRSLYTKLPDMFCFEKTKQVPAFLMRRSNRKMVASIQQSSPSFYVLSV